MSTYKIENNKLTYNFGTSKGVVDSSNIKKGGDFIYQYPLQRMGGAICAFSPRQLKPIKI